MNIALGNDSPLQGHCVRRAMRDAWVVSGLHPIVLLATEETTCHPRADECIPPVRDTASLLRRLRSVGGNEGQVDEYETSKSVESSTTTEKLFQIACELVEVARDDKITNVAVATHRLRALIVSPRGLETMSQIASTAAISQSRFWSYTPHSSSYTFLKMAVYRVAI